MDDRKLKEYALKIFQGVNGYSLNKVFSLFPKYYPKIAFYYSQLITKKQNELTTRMIQSLGITRATKIRGIAIESNAEIERIASYAIFLMKSLDVYEKGFVDEEALEEYRENVLKQHEKILDDVVDICRMNSTVFDKISEEAKKYGYNDIYTEAMLYLVKNYDFLEDVIDASEYYAERLANYQIDI